MNPNDNRYSDYVGKTLVLPLTGRTIPVVADEYVDSEFGTGAVKIHPRTRSETTLKVGLRHDLPVFARDERRRHYERNGGKYADSTATFAEKKVVEDLKDLGLLVKTEPHVHNVGHCSRCRADA